MKKYETKFQCATLAYALSMCVCACIHMCPRYAHMCVHHVSIVYICMYVCVPMCLSVSVCAYTHVCLYIYTCVYVCICMFMYACTGVYMVCVHA